MGLFKRVLSKITAGLAKTRETFVAGLRSMLLGKRLDEALISDLERRLIQSDVGVKATTRLIEGIRAEWKSGRISTGDEVLAYLKSALKAMWPPADRELASPLGADGRPLRPRVILVTGVNGAGKTTSIAKLCRTLRQPPEGPPRTVLLAACDTFRAGAVRQLEIWGERLGVDVIKGQQGADPAAVVFDACTAAKARGVDDLIVDTAGRLQTQSGLMDQLAKIRRVISKQIDGAPHEVLLVLDATTGQNALHQAREFGTAAGVTGIFLAKLDGTAKGGIVIAIKDATDIPVKLVGIGETPEDVQPFVPEDFVEAMFAE